MVKHKRLSDKPKNESVEKTDEILAEETSPEPRNLKSIVQSGTKYVYIIAAAALFSGVFTPLTLNVEVENVIYGMLVLFLGLGGGVLIFLGIQKKKLTTLMVAIGLTLIFISMLIIHEFSGKSLV